MSSFSPMRQLPANHSYQSGDVLVVFGELFQRGYANGIVEEAEKAGMKVIYSTVGRREGHGPLRSLTPEELSEKNTPLINVPLEAGFDLEPSSQDLSPVDQLKGIKLSGWASAKIDFDQVEESRLKGMERFRQSVKQYLEELEPLVPEGANVVFAHTMAGGFPRAKVVMPATNRVFKGFGERYVSSEEFWTSDIGQLCEKSFNEVTGETLNHLLDLSSPLREKWESQGRKVSYVAYGYHGTEVLINGEYRWQSYAPYLQGFAKIRLEEIAREYSSQGVNVSVFNAPEILTNSSSIFLGVEVSLYPLLAAFQKEGPDHEITTSLIDKCQSLLSHPYTLEEILKYTEEYLCSEEIQKISHFDKWPQHNLPKQMEKMRTSSSHILEMHVDEKNMITSELSEIVFKACGKIMLNEAFDIREPVWWLGHDAISKATLS